MSVSVTWDQLAIFGVLMAFLLSALVYMLSHIISSELLRAWARHEVQSLFLTLILFASLVSLASLDFVVQYRNGASDYLKMLYSDGVYCQFSMLDGMNALGMLSSLSVNINPTIFSLKGSTTLAGEPKSEGEVKMEKYTAGQAQAGAQSSITAGISLGAILQPFMTAFSDLQGFLFIPFSFLQFHIQLLDIIIKKGATLILPLGVFLRAFKFTRHGGNLLIALFIALYFILPGMYLFNKGLMQEKFGLGSTDDDMKVCENSKPGLISEFAGPVMSAAGFSGFAGMSNGPSFSDTSTLSSTILSKSENLLYTSSSSFTVVFLRVGVESTILPMFAIIVTLGLAREFAMLLGSDIDFSQLVRVV